jgi:hypothetical protein
MTVRWRLARDHRAYLAFAQFIPLVAVTLPKFPFACELHAACPVRRSS